MTDTYLNTFSSLNERENNWMVGLGRLPFACFRHFLWLVLPAHAS